MKKNIFRISASACIFLLIVFSLLYYFRTPLLVNLFGLDAYPVIVVSGTWHEMGYKLGSRKEFAENIVRTASFMKKSFPFEEAEKYFSMSKALIPENILQQMKGIADGISDVLEIPYKQAWKNILIWNFFMPATAMKACTAFAVKSDNGSFIAHNTDLKYIYGLTGTVIIFNPDKDQGHPFVSFFSPGFVGVSFGENSAGLAVVYNAAFPDRGDFGLPPLMMVRNIMETCNTLEEAINAFRTFLSKGGRFAHNGANLTFIDFKSGDMACIEVAPDRVEINRGKDINNNHFVMATNHYRLMPERNHRNDYNTSAYARLERLRMLLHLEKKYSVDSIIKILSDHDGQDQGTNHTICRHKDLNMGTNNFILFDDHFVMYYIIGNPCRFAGDPSILQAVHWKDLMKAN